MPQENTSNRLWSFSREKWIALLAGALVYALLLWLENLLVLPNILIISLKPAVVVPIVCGLLWGPLVGFGVGFLGSFGADFLITDLSYALFWDVGRGLPGLVAGFSAVVIPAYRSWKDYALAELWTLAAVYVSLDYLVVRQVTYEGLSPTAAYDIFSPLFLSNAIIALILTPIVLWLYFKFSAKR